MSITYEEALETLSSMFGPPWTRETLDAVLRHFEGHMENTVDAILSHGDGAPQDLIKKLQEGAGTGTGTGTGTGGGQETQNHSISMDEEIARQLAADEERKNRAGASGRRTGVSSPTGAGAGAAGNNNNNRSGRRSTATTTAAAAAATKKNKKGRGTPTELPPDFLRIPGYKSSTPTLDDDEQLARMLQDELFTQELANNPEFAHLAGRRSGRGMVGGPRFGGGMGGLGGSSRLTSSGFPGRQGASQRHQQQQQEGPNIMEKLSELGENAKRKLSLLAAQWNANMNRTGNPLDSGAGGGSGRGGASGLQTERRGLLDDHDDNTNEEEQVSFFGRRDSDVEMSAVSSPRAGSKKDK